MAIFSHDDLFEDFESERLAGVDEFLGDPDTRLRRRGFRSRREWVGTATRCTAGSLLRLLQRKFAIKDFFCG